jgi:NADH-quinone oxidoreductase subunit L
VELGWLWLIPTAPLATFAVAAMLALAGARRGRVFGRGLVGFLACLGPAVSFGLAVAAAWQLRGLGAEPVLRQTLYRWIESGRLAIDVGFAVDPLTAVMLLFVTGVGTLIHIYSTGYMRDDPGYVRYFAYLNLFMFAMLVLVLADSLPLLFVGWEGVGLCSYLLIGFWFEAPEKAAAGKKAFIVNRIGDFGVLVAMLIIVWTLNAAEKPSLAIADIHAHTEAFAPAVATAVCLLLFLGATGKSAQIPLYVWLPDAMAGPTPVSALIHAATMVTAGVYLLARLHFLFQLSPVAMAVVALIGALTAILAAAIAVAQTDFKKVLAYSTVSQLGYMFVGVGVGAYGAALFHVFTHAFFKACLFLGSGSVIHALHDEQDVRNMGGMKRLMPVTFWTFVIATLALAGVPPLAGFFSKDAILWEALVRPNPVWPALPRLLWALLALGAFLTAFYMWRLVALVFLNDHRGPRERFEHAHEAPRSMALPLVLLALGSVFVGFAGVPHFMGGSNRFETWLAPVFGEEGHMALELSHSGLAGGEISGHVQAVGAVQPSARAEWGATLVAVTIGLIGLLLGHQLYARAPQAAARLAARFAFLRRLLARKFYVDEVYDALVVRPTRFLADRVLWRVVDVRIIDGLVNLLGGLTKAFSYVFRFAQSGYVQTYVFVLVLGVLALLIRVL